MSFNIKGGNMKTNTKQLNLNKIILISLAIIFAFMMVLIPLQLNANAATTASNIGKVEYNGSTYHARYHVQFISTYADLGASPYEFRNISKKFYHNINIIMLKLIL